MRHPFSLLLLSSFLLAGCNDDATTITGYVEGDRLHIGLPAGGILTSVDVVRGQSVTPGQRLFQLDQQAEQARVAEARARLAQATAQRDNLLSGLRPLELEALDAQKAQATADAERAQADLRRQQDLIKSSAAARSRLDQARAEALRFKARVEELDARIAQARQGARTDEIRAADFAVSAAEAALATAEWSLERRTAAAPEAARVEDVLFQPGETAPANGPVVVLLPPDRITLRFYLGPEQIGRIRPGETLPVHCTGCPPDLTARISYVAGEASYAPPVLYSRDNAETLVFRVDAVPSAASSPAVTDVLRPGQPVRLTLPEGNS